MMSACKWKQIQTFPLNWKLVVLFVFLKIIFIMKFQIHKSRKNIVATHVPTTQTFGHKIPQIFKK